MGDTATLRAERTRRDSLLILYVEDSDDDVLLVLHELRQAGFAVEYERVATEAQLRAALPARPWDVILSDYSMPNFDGIAAYRIVKELNYDIPFLFVSGRIGEEKAAEIMRQGAKDYVAKDNLKRLVPALQRELTESAERRTRKIGRAHV